MENLNGLKLDLILEIIRCNDLEKLQKIQNLLSKQTNFVSESDLNYEVSEPNTPIYFSEETAVLSDVHLEMIRIAEEDIKAGRTISHEELKKMDEKWMK